LYILQAKNVTLWICTNICLFQTITIGNPSINYKINVYGKFNKSSTTFTS
jgi:hypothetical protein